MSEAAYRLEGIRQDYGGRVALELDELVVPARRILGVAGPNGSGKSTLMRLLAMLEDPAQGSVWFHGRLCGQNGDALRRDVTLLTQEPYLLKRSVAANVAYGLKVRGLRGERETVRWALEMVGLDPDSFARRAWYELSGGEAQRVALAARLALRPKVLLLDEPTASLDEESALRIRDASLAAREQWGATLVAVSHDMAWLRSLADDLIHLRGGRLVDDPATAPRASVYPAFVA